MGYTRIGNIGRDKIFHDPASWSKIHNTTSYFYPEDISVVLSQPGAVAVQVVPAEFPTNDASAPFMKTLIAIGLKLEEDQEGRPIYVRMDGDNNSAALFCGRFNHIPGENVPKKELIIDATEVNLIRVRDVN